MSIFFSYVLLGLSLAIPIGPINAAQLDKGIKGGFFPAWFVGLGAIVADGIYMLIVYFGIFHMIDTPFVKTFLWLFGCFVLVYTGLESIISAKKIELSKQRNTESLSKSFFSGFMMSITNPLTILFWLGIYGSVLAKTASSFGTKELILYSGAIFLGLLAWDFTMAIVSSSFRTFLKSRALQLLSVVSGLSLIGFGIYFGVEGLKLLIGLT
ncbi:LysE family translocator [Salirhabdus sp. Marseille-P4669]|uniref:LysE family translocator n=1 Tax=Salirhabdus sp. Marseille-P4669 TaxID=2042310 RepID=UPI000C7C24C1|nr:LysE family transporter [Salirhabdus sp. Marseille-P4669]